MTGDETAHAVSFLEKLSVDYMIQNPVPESHKFSYRYRGNGNPDFLTRLNVYKNHCRPLETIPRTFGPSSQFVVIVPGPDAADVLAETQDSLKEFSVIKTTSPFDGKTLWIEIFPKSVSKGNAVKWLANELNIQKAQTAAVGNDYNDEDLLDWFKKSYVVDNGPDDLKAGRIIVPSNDHDGVCEAVRQFIHY
jgi:HAD superfamily hydrolase (TIGR01484 family)